MTPIGLFMQAGLVGKAVIIVLLVMSIWCWVLILEGWVGLIRLRSAVRRLHNGGRNHISPLLLPIIEAGETAANSGTHGTAGEKRQRIGEAMRRPRKFCSAGSTVACPVWPSFLLWRRSSGCSALSGVS